MNGIKFSSDRPCNYENRPSGHVSFSFLGIFSSTGDTKKLLKTFVFRRIMGGYRLGGLESQKLWATRKNRNRKRTTDSRERNKDYQSEWQWYRKELSHISLRPVDSFALPITPPLWNLWGTLVTVSFAIFIRGRRNRKYCLNVRNTGHPWTERIPKIDNFSLVDR